MSCPTRSRVGFFRRAFSPGKFRESAFFMKKIECRVEESEVQPLLGALMKTGIGGVTVHPVEGKMMQMEIVTLDIETDYVVGTILEVTHQREISGNQIAVFPVEEVIRIRTGEKGAKAVF
jgi:nitrogen regulatory protein PII